MTRKTLELTPALHDYLLAHSLREAPVLEQLRAQTAQLALSRMQIAPEQGQFLALLARLIGARRTLDVGVFTGYSALSVALALAPGGQVVGCDTSAEWTAVAQAYFARAGVADRLDLRLAPARQTLDELILDGQSGRFDFAFIDADKTGYTDYYERCLRLVRPGGVVAIDNTLWDGKVAESAANDADTQALRRFNRVLHQDDRVDLSLLPLADGVTIARRR